LKERSVEPAKQELSLKFAETVETQHGESLQIYCEGKNATGRSYRLPMKVSFSIISPVDARPKRLIFTHVGGTTEVVIRVDSDKVKLPIILQDHSLGILGPLVLDSSLTVDDKPSIQFYRINVTSTEKSLEKGVLPNTIEIVDREGALVGSIEIESL